MKQSLSRQTSPRAASLLKRAAISFLWIAFAITQHAANSEQDLIAVLQSGAGVPAKCAVCQQLRIVGTARSVPVLAAFLNDERISQAARYALEAMPAPEAGVALREALGSTSGVLKAGVIDSLGWRQDGAAVPLVVPLLADANPVVAAAAASALGRIGGQEATAALLATFDKAAPDQQALVAENLIECAERLRTSGASADAIGIFRRVSLAKLAPHVHAAAWRGLLLADAGQQRALLPEALSSDNRSLRVMALRVLRESRDARVIQACLKSWDSLAAESQLALMDAQFGLGGEMMPTLLKAAQSPYLGVRLAAWQGMGGLSQASAVPLLAAAAAAGEPAERTAARESLARIRGAGVREALATGLAGAEAPVQAELLRAIGERGDSASASLLVGYATSGPEQVRLAALESLRKLAVPDAIPPLLELAARSESETLREPALKALHAACQASGDKEQTSRRVVDAIQRFQPGERRRVLPLLADLGTAEALAAAQAAARDRDDELAKEALRVQAQWPSAAPAVQLLEVARASNDPTTQTLALRGCIQVLALEPDLARRLAALQQALNLAKRAEEKRQALAQVGQVALPEAIPVALGYLNDPALVNEAGFAAVSVAEKLAASHPKLVGETAGKVLAQCKDAEIVKRAWVLRGQPKGAGSFIREWLVSGPFTQAGVTGAEGAFRAAFAPEVPGAKVTWKPMPKGDSANLSAVFPDQSSCAAYLKTIVLAPVEIEAALLLGSDDGVKAWLNGEVVHSNNADRGQVADQDMAPIKLKKGANELMLKISQGGGGWSACARIVGRDGAPIDGLRIELPPADSKP